MVLETSAKTPAEALLLLAALMATNDCDHVIAINTYWVDDGDRFVVTAVC